MAPYGNFSTLLSSATLWASPGVAHDPFSSLSFLLKTLWVHPWHFSPYLKITHNVWKAMHAQSPLGCSIRNSHGIVVYKGVSLTIDHKSINANNTNYMRGEAVDGFGSRR